MFLLFFKHEKTWGHQPNVAWKGDYVPMEPVFFEFSTQKVKLKGTYTIIVKIC